MVSPSTIMIFFRAQTISYLAPVFAIIRWLAGWRLNRSAQIVGFAITVVENLVAFTVEEENPRRCKLTYTTF